MFHYSMPSCAADTVFWAFQYIEPIAEPTCLKPIKKEQNYYIPTVFIREIVPVFHEG
jgi:hypothetical protein